MPHLWDVNHPYYCSEADRHTEYRSWTSFLDAYGSSDRDMNLIFRWDWFNDDDNRLCIYIVEQRRGRLTSHDIHIAEADEPAVREWLTVRWAHLCRMWEPISRPGRAE